MDRSLQDGMQTFDQSLFALYKEGKIELEEALNHADSRDGLALKVRLAEGADVPMADTFDVNSY
jgi:twitching motility protein PilU